MFNTKNTDDLHHFLPIKIAVKDGKLHCPLFHGTREYMLNITDREKDELQKNGMTVLTFLREYYREHNDFALDSICTPRGFKLVYSAVMLQAEEADNYQYGDLYFTTSFVNAVSYAQNLCGELFECTYTCAKAILEFGIANENETVLTAARYLVDFYDKVKDSPRIVLLIAETDMADLQPENGVSLADFSKKNLMDQLIDNIKEGDFQYSFRVSHIEKYPIYVIPAKQFVKAKEIFGTPYDETLADLCKIRFDSNATE